MLMSKRKTVRCTRSRRRQRFGARQSGSDDSISDDEDHDAMAIHSFTGGDERSSGDGANGSGGGGQVQVASSSEAEPGAVQFLTKTSSLAGRSHSPT
jgi:hypothetical protein